MKLATPAQKPSKRRRDIRPVHGLSILDALLRHPLTLVVVGFALTGGVGGFLQDRQAEIQRTQAALSAAYAAETKVLTAIVEFTTRAKLYAEKREEFKSDTELAELDRALLAVQAAVLSSEQAILAPFGYTVRRDSSNGPEATLGVLDATFNRTGINVYNMRHDKAALGQYTDALEHCAFKMFALLNDAYENGGKLKFKHFMAHDNGALRNWPENQQNKTLDWPQRLLPYPCYTAPYR
jgi:hypothetical protein